MIGLPYGEKNYDDMLSCFHVIVERHGRTDRIAISISCVSVLTHDKNKNENCLILNKLNEIASFTRLD